MSEHAGRLPKTMAAIARGLESRTQTAAQLYVSLSGELVADVAMGEARPGVLMQNDTLMPWLSAGKSIAAIAIAQLFGRGAIGLDDCVAQHIPEFSAGGKDAITLRHLLTHTCGFRAVPGDFENQPWEKVIADICAVRLEAGWIVGETAGYHPATSWYILGELVRRIDGRTFEDYVRQEIFAPLAMASATLVLANAIGTPVRPGSSLHTPACELGAFYEMLRDGGRELLRRDTVDLFTSRQRIGLYDKTFRHIMDWGLGFIVQSNRYGAETVPYSYGPHASDQTFGHGGSRSSIAYCDPAHGLVVAVVLSRAMTEAQHHERMWEVNAAIYEDLKLA